MHQFGKANKKGNSKKEKSKSKIDNSRIMDLE